MATFEINENLLREYVNELIASDEDLEVDENLVNEKITDILSGLAESPEEILSEIIVDNIYFELLDEDNEDIES